MMVLFGALVCLLIFVSSFAIPVRELSSALTDTDIPSFVKWPRNLPYLDCSRLLGGDNQYIKASKKRVSHSDSASHLNVSRTCEEYYARGHYYMKPLSEEEAAFPIAFANTVFQNLDLLERIFSVMYAPQNIYCYVLDSKASANFKARFLEWADCFPNVIVTPVSLPVSSDGHNVINAQLACMRALDAFDWKYLITLQNHDIPLRSNAELVRILDMFDGANDISTLKITSIPSKANWSFNNIKLFRNDSMNKRYFSNGRVEGRLYLTKSLVSVSISRDMVNFVIHQLNVTGFVNEIEKGYYGIDENFISTLNSNDLLGAPGGFTRACLLRGEQVSSITRYVVWNPHREDCQSKNFRHTVCIFGIEDLPYLIQRNELFANKMMAEYDYGAAMCWLETIYNRTHFSRGGFEENANKLNAPYVHLLREEYYTSLPHVRLNRLRKVDGGRASPTKNNIFFKLLHETDEDKTEWHIMKSLYEVSNDKAGAKFSFTSNGIMPFDDADDSYFDKSKKKFDYLNFNCTHPFRDYYF